MFSILANLRTVGLLTSTISLCFTVLLCKNTILPKNTSIPCKQGRSIVAAVPPGIEDDIVSCVLRLKTALQLLLTIILYSAPATVL